MSRVALVTGGSRGIGAAISMALKEAGCQVAATYAGNDEKAAAFTAETGIKTYKWDVADYDACAAGIAQVAAGQFAQANYAAAKAGDIGFTKALAQEGARAGITVNVVAPGYINTEMMSTIPEKVMNEVILPQIPVGRLGEASEIARTVAFLTSDDAGFITGSTISANGGQYMS